MIEPMIVQNMTQAQGIGIVMLGESIDDTGLNLLQYYGSNDWCELHDDSCSTDEILWGSGDFGAPVFCTSHNYPEEELGYELVDLDG